MRNKVAIYRHFNESGELLYVGRSRCPLTRLAQHAGGSDWYEDIATITIEWVDETGAHRAEWEAIHRENPKHNLAGKKPAKSITFKSEAERERVEKAYFSKHNGHAIRIIASDILGQNVKMVDLVATFGKA